VSKKQASVRPSEWKSQNYFIWGWGEFRTSYNILENNYWVVEWWV